MSDSPTAHSPIVIDRVERSRGDGGTVRLRLGGRRLVARGRARARRVAGRAGCVGTGTGLPRRRPATRIRRPDRGGRASRCPSGRCRSSTARRRCGSARSSVPVPPVGTRVRTPEPTGAGEPAAVSERGRSGPASVRVGAVPGGVRAACWFSRRRPRREAGRAGPLADALLRETVAALHAELEQRSGREAALDGALERARAELAARTASQAELEATHAELRAELARLVEAVAEQQAEFERRLDQAGERSDGGAGADARRDRPRAGRAARATLRARACPRGARTEAERVRSELTQARAERRPRPSGPARPRAAAELLEVREQEGIAARAAGDHDDLTRRGGRRGGRPAGRAVTARVRAGRHARAGRRRTTVSSASAQQLLEDARALTAQLRGQSGPERCLRIAPPRTSRGR